MQPPIDSFLMKSLVVLLATTLHFSALATPSPASAANQYPSSSHTRTSPSGAPIVDLGYSIHQASIVNVYHPDFLLADLFRRNLAIVIYADHSPLRLPILLILTTNSPTSATPPPRSASCDSRLRRRLSVTVLQASRTDLTVISVHRD